MLPKRLDMEASSEGTRRPPIKRYPNRTPEKNKIARARYFTNVIKDIENPRSKSAQGRRSKRFRSMQDRAEQARRGQVIFHDKGHGGDKDIETLWRDRLVKEGLDLGPYTSFESLQAWRKLEHHRQWQMASWWSLGSGHDGAWSQWPRPNGWGAAWWTRG